jgi:heme/copper-type cytochrome/quinol oxidase subunit 3
MIISVPSVVLISSLMLSLWGGSIAFTTPMLFALGIFQLAFVINLVASLRGRTRTRREPNERATSIPWTGARPETRISNVRLGIWLFLASEAMLFGSFLSAYVLLRAGSTGWPDAASLLHPASALLMAFVLAAGTAALSLRSPRRVRVAAIVSFLLFAVFVAMKAADYRNLLMNGQTPAANLLLASWFVLTGAHAIGWSHRTNGSAGLRLSWRCCLAAAEHSEGRL